MTDGVVGLLTAPLNAPRRRHLKRALGAGPWSWPDDAALRSAAAELMGCEPPPVGQRVLALTVSDTRASVWALSVGEPPVGEPPVHAHDVWETASVALARSLPFLWRPVEGARRRHPVARRVGSVVLSAPERPEGTLTGPSLGLSFSLLQAALILRRDLPAEIACSASVALNGQTRRVDGMPEKLRVLGAWAPAVRRVLVASSQADEARAACRSAALELEIVGVESVAHAVEQVFGQGMRDEIVQAGEDEASRSELVESFFRLAMRPHRATPDWRPVARAAELALESWPGLPAAERGKLEVARGIAARHAGLSATYPVPDPQWLTSIHRPLRLRLVAHTVQQCHDLGSPGLDETTRLVDRYLVRGLEAGREHRHVLGAWGRLLASTGRVEEALDAQREAALAAVQCGDYAEVSYPLAEWLRVSGVAREAGSFEEADGLFRRLWGEGAFEPYGLPFVQLARGRGLAMLGRSADAAAQLGALVERGHRLPGQYTLASAARWLGVAYLGLGDRAGWEAALENIPRERTLHRTLARLDRALADGDAAQVDALMRVIEGGHADAQAMCHVLAASRRAPNPPDLLVRLYPY